MSKLTSDPLLAAAKVILAVGAVLLIFVMAVVAIAIGVVLTVRRGEILAELAQAGAPDSAYWAIIVALVLVGGLMFLALRFLLELRGIVHSVDGGDPFEPENANRLSRMGWLMVGGYALGLVLGALATWIKAVGGDAGKLDVEANMDLGGGGILLILTLFILARVFRQGAAMRADLEGTV